MTNVAAWRSHPQPQPLLSSSTAAEGSNGWPAGAARRRVPGLRLRVCPTACVCTHRPRARTRAPRGSCTAAAASAQSLASSLPAAQPAGGRCEPQRRREPHGQGRERERGREREKEQKARTCSRAASALLRTSLSGELVASKADTSPFMSIAAVRSSAAVRGEREREKERERAGRGGRGAQRLSHVQGGAQSS